jgi:transcriptional regulator with XRE-family HTH domain
MDVAKRFGENLRRVRKGAGISQEELGFRSELHRTEIGLLERGARVPRIDTMIKIASGLGIRIDFPLLEGISWTPATQTTQAGGFMLTSRAKEHAGPVRAAALGRGNRAPPTVAAEARESRRELE